MFLLNIGVTLHYYPVSASRKLSSDKYRHRKGDDLHCVKHRTLLILSSALFIINTLISCNFKNLLLDGRSSCRWKRKRGRYSVEFTRHITEN